MKAVLQHQNKPASLSPSVYSSRGWVQRKCACGKDATTEGECPECRKKKQLGLQTKLAIGTPGDRYEREADQIADQFAETPTASHLQSAPPHIQRLPGNSHPGGEQGTERVGDALSDPGKPLEPALRTEMDHRFGFDFSQVRVHSGRAAEESAHGMEARAYTVGHEVVFGAGEFAPKTRDGRRLIAHELTHVVQQQAGTPQSIQRAPKTGAGPPSVTVTGVDIKSSDPNCQYGKGEAERANSPAGIIENDIDKGEFFGVEPADALVISDFKIGEGSLRSSTAANFQKFWVPTFDKSTLNTLEAVGFSDCVDWESRNKTLREQRAQSVARFLPGLTARAAGFDEYPTANASERGRAINRSVIIKPKAKAPPPPPPPPPPRKHEATITMDEPETEGCSSDQRRQLAIAFPAAKMMAQKARAAVISQNKGPVINFLLERYFGEDARSHLSEILAGYDKILNNWQDWEKKFECQLQTEGFCKSDDPHRVTIAYVKNKRHVFSAKESYGTVYVCAQGFNDPGNMQKLSATILHELSHRLDNTSDKQYCGSTELGKCATLSIGAAIDNADSYAQFAREIFNVSL